MKSSRFAAFLFSAVFLVIGLASASEPGVEQRLADLEAYVRNTAPTGPLQGQPGPGHNGWMMLSAGMVLFMSLPGLALFYGGLVRRKNVLSVMAQCLGLAGLVGVMWWAFGYSVSFAPGSPWIGGFQRRERGAARLSNSGGFRSQGWR